VTAISQPSRSDVVVVGSGSLFASGISHYTNLLSSALADEYEFEALLMRRPVPRRLYPGRDHVDAAVANSVISSPNEPVYDGVDCRKRVPDMPSLPDLSSAAQPVPAEAV
jgi:hypothetical protein